MVILVITNNHLVMKNTVFTLFFALWSILALGQHLSDFLQYQQTILPGNEIEFRYASSFLSASEKQHLILVNRDVDREGKPFLVKGYFVDLKKNTSAYFEIALDRKQYRDAWSVRSIAFGGGYLLLNLSNQQVLFKQDGHNFEYVRKYAYTNIETVFIEGETVLFTRLGKYINSFGATENRVITGSISSNDTTCGPVAIKGRAFRSIHPSNYYDYYKGNEVVLNPIDYALTVTTRGGEAQEYSPNYSDWMAVRDQDLRTIERAQDSGELAPFLRELTYETARVWSVSFMGEDQMFVVYHYPDIENDKMLFYVDVWEKAKTGTWTLKHSKMARNQHRSMEKTTVLNKTNFPACFENMGNKTIITADYICILTEEEAGSFEGKTYAAYFDAVKQHPTLKLHVFKRAF